MKVGNESMDGYVLFFKEFLNETDSKEISLKLWYFTENNMKCVDSQNAKKSWEILCRSIEEKKSNVFVRKYGRKSQNDQPLLKSFYKYLFEESFEINIDRNNNDRPKEMLSEFTGYSVKNEKDKNKLNNFQTSHVFARTKNCFAFTAPWNLVYLPKILDPFTGHEAKGEIKIRFEKYLHRYFCNKYASLIRDFNSKMTLYQEILKKEEKLREYLSEVEKDIKVVNRFIKAMKKEFEPIDIDRILGDTND